MKKHTKYLPKATYQGGGAKRRPLGAPPKAAPVALGTYFVCFFTYVSLFFYFPNGFCRKDCFPRPHLSTLRFVIIARAEEAKVSCLNSSNTEAGYWVFLRVQHLLIIFVSKMIFLIWNIYGDPNSVLTKLEFKLYSLRFAEYQPSHTMILPCASWRTSRKIWLIFDDNLQKFRFSQEKHKNQLIAIYLC